MLPPGRPLAPPLQSHPPSDWSSVETGRATIGQDRGGRERHVYIGPNRKLRAEKRGGRVVGSWQPAAMEHAEEPLSARPALETEGLRFLHVTGEGRRGVRREPPCSVGRPPGGLALSPWAGGDSGLGRSAASSKSPWLGGRSRTSLARAFNTFLLQ